MKLRSNPFASQLQQSPASRATRLLATTALTLTLIAPSAMAASQTWDGGGASTTTPGAGTALNTAANWNGALPTGDGSSMIFESTTNLSLSASTSGFGNSSTVQFNLQQNGTGNLTLDSSYATASGNSFRFDQINLDGDAGNLTFGNGIGTAFNVVLGKNMSTAPGAVLHTWTNSNANATVTFETEAGFTLGPSNASYGRILTLAGDGNWNFKNNIPTASAFLSFTKTGNGTATFSGNNSYTGTTSVDEGTLVVNGTHSGTGAVTVASGAKLGGTGTLAASTTISGILAPGNSIGTLTVGNDVTWQGAASVGSNTNWQDELGATNTSDLLNITGASSEFIKDTSVGSFFNFDFLGSTTTGTFTLVDWQSTVDLAGGVLGTNFQLTDFSYTNLGGGNTGTFGFDGSSLQFTVVPEPRAALIGSIGMLMLLRRRRSSLA